MSATQLLRILTDLPLWEQDALKKMLSHGSFDEQDRLRALALIQQAAGIRHEGPVLVAEPVSADDLIHFAPAAGALFLAGVEAVIDCNALAPGARLPIEPTTGLNIYVGRNGSGKVEFHKTVSGCREFSCAGQHSAGCVHVPFKQVRGACHV
ncbi:MAG: hypothetical protein IPK16_28080 [Anaerolineales bacterium]|nr:hypothetical protein [Anaerolineales bacterium]